MSYREGYSDGYEDGFAAGQRGQKAVGRLARSIARDPVRGGFDFSLTGGSNPQKPKRKLSAWNKFVKANSKKPRFRLRSGSPNLKKLGVAFRKTPAGKKK